MVAAGEFNRQGNRWGAHRTDGRADHLSVPAPYAFPPSPYFPGPASATANAMASSARLNS